MTLCRYNSRALLLQAHGQWQQATNLSRTGNTHDHPDLQLTYTWVHHCCLASKCMSLKNKHSTTHQKPHPCISVLLAASSLCSAVHFSVVSESANSPNNSHASQLQSHSSHLIILNGRQCYEFTVQLCTRSISCNMICLDVLASEKVKLRVFQYRIISSTFF